MSFDPRQLSRRDLRRLVKDMWSDPRCNSIARPTLMAAVEQDAQSLDRAVVAGYLRHFPTSHPEFETLNSVARFTAERRDWVWRERGKRWELWDHRNAPSRLAKAMLGAGVGEPVLSDAGLEGDLAQGELVRRAVVSACLVAADAHGDQAETYGTALIGLFDSQDIAGQKAILAYGLLAPWQSDIPSKNYQQKMSRILVDRIGDPRINGSAWDALNKELRDQHGLELEAATTTLKRWLTEAAFRAFFKIVRMTTDRQDQWDQREAFWTGYLEAGYVKEAWFAFGKEAEARAAKLADDEDVHYARIEGQGATPTQTALIMTIGQTRIAEWSDNGATRFWDMRDPTAPPMYQSRYYGTNLRAMKGGRGFDEAFVHISHTVSWQRKFAGHLYKVSGLRHPVWGEGMRSTHW